MDNGRLCNTPPLEEAIPAHLRTVHSPSTRDRRSGDNITLTPDVPLALPVPDDPASGHPRSRNLPGSSPIKDYSAVHDATSGSDFYSPINENDVVIAYVFLRLRVLSLDNISSLG